MSPMPIDWDPEFEAVAFIKDRVKAALGADISNVFHAIIPQEASLPAVRVQFFYRHNTMTNGQDITMTTLRGHVLAVIPDGGGATSQDLARRIAAALHKASGTAAGATALVLAVTYLGPITFTEGDRGSFVRHAGGEYEIILQVAP